MNRAAARARRVELRCQIFRGPSLPSGTGPHFLAVGSFLSIQELEEETEQLRAYNFR